MRFTETVLETDTYGVKGGGGERLKPPPPQTVAPPPTVAPTPISPRTPPPPPCGSLLTKLTARRSFESNSLEVRCLCLIKFIGNPNLNKNVFQIVAIY